MKKIIVASLLGIILLVTGVYFILTNQPDQKLVIDGKEYSKNAIINDFIDVAFTDSVLAGDEQSNAADPRWDGMKNVRPWLFENLVFPPDLPKTNVINKWVAPVTIGFNDPDLFHYHNSMREGWKDRPLMVEGIVREMLPAFRQATGLTVEMLTKEDTKENPARLRIYYSMLNVVPRYGSFDGGWFVNEPYFSNGVSFEGSDTSMHAYFLPNGNNQIGLSICKMKVSKDKERAEIVFAKFLVSECLLRSMGMPGLLRKKRLFQKPSESILVEGSRLKYKGNSRSEGDARDESFTSFHLSDYDLFLLSILYCDTIKPGMTKWQVRSILKENDRCFNVRKEM